MLQLSGAIHVNRLNGGIMLFAFLSSTIRLARIGHLSIIAAVIVAGVPRVVSGQAHDSTRMPFVLEAIQFCESGEPVNIDGVSFVQATGLTLPDGGDIFEVTFTNQGTAIGLDTGTHYQFANTEHTTLAGVGGTGGSVFHTSGFIRLVGPGPAHGAEVNIVVQLTVDANGEMRTDIFREDRVCPEPQP